MSYLSAKINKLSNTSPNSSVKFSRFSSSAKTVSFRAEKQFVPGNVLTHDPGIYSPGIGVVRIEDELLLTAEGNRVLTHAAKELILLSRLGEHGIPRESDDYQRGL